MIRRQRIQLSKEVIDIVGDHSRVTGESVATLIEELIMRTNWLKESGDCDRQERNNTE